MRPPVSSGTVFVKDHADVWNNEHTIGNAELAARLGSPVSFDRRGTVFAYDDFEDAPLKWQPLSYTFSGGVGHSVTLSNESPSHGSGCMKIINPDAVGDISQARRRIGGVATHRIGMEMDITFESTTQTKPSIVFEAFTGTHLINAGIRLQQSGAGGLSYLNSTGANPKLDASYTHFNNDFVLSTDTPYPLKFVVDLDNEKYARCIFGGIEIDMSSYTPYATPSVGDVFQRVVPSVYVVSNDTTNYSTYINNFILTIEEPE